MNQLSVRPPVCAFMQHPAGFFRHIFSTAIGALQGSYKKAAQLVLWLNCCSG
jgi:hypothetical protein